jgi:hypothetical protein
MVTSVPWKTTYSDPPPLLKLEWIGGSSKIMSVHFNFGGYVHKVHVFTFCFIF